MRDGFIIHPEDVLPLRPHMSTENFGELLIALCLFAIGETPSEMAPPVGTAYAFLTSRISALACSGASFTPPRICFIPYLFLCS